VSRITFVTRRGSGAPVAEYLLSWGRPLGGALRLRSHRRTADTHHWGRRLRYLGLHGLPLALRALRPAHRWSGARDAVLFCDLERLSPVETEHAVKHWKALAARRDPPRLLNHPARALRRYELLRLLCDGGWNAHDAWRVIERRTPRRFPVFLRGDGHRVGILTDLLHTPAELDAALARLAQEEAPREDLLVVEFTDTRSADGLYRKYAAFRVGDRIVPRHVLFSKHWAQSHADESSAALAEEELAYLRGNPHADALREVFERARIDYGRIDYGVRNGRVQVWEINTNPTILKARMWRDAQRLAVHRHFADAFVDALDALTR
jgi:hypothetical protein